MRHIACGYYSAEAAQKKFGEDVLRDIVDRCRFTFGLIRTGVAPDHQSIKAVCRGATKKPQYRRHVPLLSAIVTGWRDVRSPNCSNYMTQNALILATERTARTGRWDIPSSDCRGWIASAAFAAGYNGHPDFKISHPPLACPVGGDIPQWQCRSARCCPDFGQDRKMNWPAAISSPCAGS